MIKTLSSSRMSWVVTLHNLDHNPSLRASRRSSVFQVPTFRLILLHASKSALRPQSLHTYSEHCNPTNTYLANHHLRLSDRSATRRRRMRMSCMRARQPLTSTCATCQTQCPQATARSAPRRARSFPNQDGMNHSGVWIRSRTFTEST